MREVGIDRLGPLSAPEGGRHRPASLPRASARSELKRTRNVRGASGLGGFGGLHSRASIDEVEARLLFLR